MKCGLTGNEVGNASNLKVIKPGTHEWKQAVAAIRGGKNSNFRTATEKDAIDLVNQGRGCIQRQGEIGDPYNENGGHTKKDTKFTQTKHIHRTHQKITHLMLNGRIGKQENLMEKEDMCFSSEHDFYEAWRFEDCDDLMQTMHSGDINQRR